MSSYEVQDHSYAASSVLHVMNTLHMGPADEPGEPGVNDPTHRVGAFCYGAQLACRPLVETYLSTQPAELQKVFDSTFRLSFHFSAGVPLIQSMYQTRIARLLREKYTEAAVSAAAERAVFDPATAVPPGRHVQGRAMARAQSRAPKIWQFYMDILKCNDQIADLKPRDKMDANAIDLLQVFGNESFIPLGLPYYLLSRECDYAENGRPNKNDDSSRYRSDIAEHALKGKQIGNPEFNLIFSEMGVALSALKQLSLDQLPDFYLITETKKRLNRLEALVPTN